MVAKIKVYFSGYREEEVEVFSQTEMEEEVDRIADEATNDNPDCNIDSTDYPDFEEDTDENEDED